MYNKRFSETFGGAGLEQGFPSLRSGFCKIFRLPFNMRNLNKTPSLTLPLGEGKVAFTLAEVLITLGIIGVVAVITMPTLIQNYKKTVYVNQLKKCVSTWSQGVKKVLADEETDNIDNTEIFSKISEEISKNGCLSNFDSVTCQYHEKLAKNYFNAEIKMRPDNYEYKYFNLSDSDVPDDVFYAFPDGSVSQFKDITEDSLIITVDVNGFYKGPNIYGRDIFSFRITSNGAVVKEEGNFMGSEYCPDGTVDAHVSCFAYLMENGWKMDY